MCYRVLSFALLSNVLVLPTAIPGIQGTQGLALVQSMGTTITTAMPSQSPGLLWTSKIVPDIV